MDRTEWGKIQKTEIAWVLEFADESLSWSKYQGLTCV